jgi:hypothetical protein
MDLPDARDETVHRTGSHEETVHRTGSDQETEHRPLAGVRRNTAGMAPGSIIGAIIDIHAAAKRRTSRAWSRPPIHGSHLVDSVTQPAAGPPGSLSARRPS